MRQWLAVDEDNSIYHYKEIEGPELSVEQSVELNGKPWATIVNTGNYLKITTRDGSGKEFSYNIEYTDLDAIRDYLLISKEVCTSTIYELKELSDND